MYEYEDYPSGICDCCGDACSAVPTDVGYGTTEFWGSVSTHVDIRPLSPCCEAEVVPGGEKRIESTTHVARKEHNGGKIQPGDTYRRTVYFRWRQDGPGWFVAYKRLIKKAEEPCSA